MELSPFDFHFANSIQKILFGLVDAIRLGLQSGISYLQFLVEDVIQVVLALPDKSGLLGGGPAPSRLDIFTVIFADHTFHFSIRFIILDFIMTLAGFTLGTLTWGHFG